MDSFEWFGEIGNQSYDSLKPPGDVFREVFNTATMGLESFGGGGGGDSGQKRSQRKQQKAQDKYNKKRYDYDNEIAMDQWEHTKEINKATKDFNDEVHEFKTEERNESYNHAKKMRKFAHEEKIRGRDNVIKNINKQLAHNDVAMQVANKQAGQVRTERLKKLELNAKTSRTEYGKNVEGLKLKADTSKLEFQTKIKGLNIEEAATYFKHRISTKDIQNKRTQTTLKYQDQAADMAFKQMSSQREMVKARGKVRAFSQAGQSAQASDRDIIEAFKQNDAQNFRKITTMDAFATSELYGIDNAMIGLAGQRHYEMGLQALKKHHTVESRTLQIRGQETEQKYLDLFRGIRLEEERETGLSIHNAYDRMIEDTKLKHEGARISAEAKIPLVPRLGPAPIKPAALPQQKIINPPKPKKGPKPIKSASYMGGGAQVQGSMTGSVLGGLSAGATALGAFGSMAASGGGAIGLGGLGTIGLGAMGPIGLGIGLVAGVGSIFNWW